MQRSDPRRRARITSFALTGAFDLGDTRLVDADHAGLPVHEPLPLSQERLCRSDRCLVRADRQPNARHGAAFAVTSLVEVARPDAIPDRCPRAGTGYPASDVQRVQPIVESWMCSPNLRPSSESVSPAASRRAARPLARSTLPAHGRRSPRRSRFPLPARSARTIEFLDEHVGP